MSPSAHPSKTVALAFADGSTSTGLLYQLSESPTPQINNAKIDDDGSYVFGDSIAVDKSSYLQLAYSMHSIKIAKSLTIETLIKYDNINSLIRSSTLFSFGTATTHISFPGVFISQSLDITKFIHLAVVFNFVDGYTKVLPIN